MDDSRHLMYLANTYVNMFGYILLAPPSYRALYADSIFHYNFNCHSGSPKCVSVSTPMPLLIERISPLDIFICPTARACSLPSAITATTVSNGISPSIRAPFDVNPGHLYKSIFYHTEALHYVRTR